MRGTFFGVLCSSGGGLAGFRAKPTYSLRPTTCRELTGFRVSTLHINLPLCSIPTLLLTLMPDFASRLDHPRVEQGHGHGQGQWVHSFAIPHPPITVGLIAANHLLPIEFPDTQKPGSVLLHLGSESLDCLLRASHSAEPHIPLQEWGVRPPVRRHGWQER